MRRVRARIATNVLDREILERLNRAEKIVVDAVELAQDAARKAPDRLSRMKIRRVAIGLTRLARSFDEVGLVGGFPMEFGEETAPEPSQPQNPVQRPQRRESKEERLRRIASNLEASGALEPEVDATPAESVSEASEGEDGAPIDQETEQW